MKICLQLLSLCLMMSGVLCGCEQQTSCNECAGYAACYWCESSGKCQDYYGEKFANLLCPNKWVQHQSLCPASSKVNDILEILKNVKSNYRTKDPQGFSSLLSQETGAYPAENQRQTSGDTSSELKELLHKLLLLKLLRKLKNEGSGSLTAEDRQMLNQLANSNLATHTTTTTTKSPSSGNVNNEIQQLLSILKSKTSTSESPVTKNPPKSKISTAKTPLSLNPSVKPTSVANQNKSLVKPASETSANTSQSIMKLLKKIDEQNAGVVYEEHKTDAILKPSTSNTTKLHKIPAKNVSAPVIEKHPMSTPTTTMNYCGLYLEVELCNSDNNCTWCNTRDLCIRRSGSDYRSCVAAKDQMKDKEFGLDKCLINKHCKQCVENSKCYWCDVSKSCHTYPFIGYVPESCGGDWYVKQCDVQLAVIIIVLPLIIILLAMVTFYFCLKYCYYRRKVLRVPLFEKPGVFDYRKDKKVYYVNPEDESSDTEMAVENIRKKYRLPVEREPLIDPNS